MKKFKCKKKFNKIKLLIVILSFLVVFIIFSFFKLNKSFPNLIDISLSKFINFDHKRFVLSSNLDYLFSDHAFKEINKSNYKQYKVYLYNTHDNEKYIDNTKVTDTSKLLRDKLVKLGIKVILEEKLSSNYNYLGLSPYNISKMFLIDVMNKEKDINYYIDIHRDSVEDTIVTINNKKYAKILFVLGLENKEFKKNKIILEKMNNYLNDKYPGISRGIYEKKGSSVDGVYNQNLNENVILIEVGGIDNNIDEVNNSTEILALMIYDLLGEEDEKEYQS